MRLFISVAGHTVPIQTAFVSLFSLTCTFSKHRLVRVPTIQAVIMIASSARDLSIFSTAPFPSRSEFQTIIGRPSFLVFKRKVNGGGDVRVIRQTCDTSPTSYICSIKTLEIWRKTIFRIGFNSTLVSVKFRAIIFCAIPLAIKLNRHFPSRKSFFISSNPLNFLKYLYFNTADH